MLTFTVSTDSRLVKTVSVDFADYPLKFNVCLISIHGDDHEMPPSSSDIIPFEVTSLRE